VCLDYKNTHLVLFRKISAIYYDNHMKYIVIVVKMRCQRRWYM